MNDEILLLIEQTMASIITYFLMYLTYEKIYTPKKKSKKRILLYIFIVLIFIILIHLFRNTYINFLFYLLSSQILCHLLYNASFKTALIYNLFFYGFLMFGDIIAVCVCSVIFQKDLKVVVHSSQMMIIAGLIYIMIMILFYKIFIDFFKAKKLFSLKIKESLFFLLLTLFEFFVLYYLILVISNINAKSIIIINIGFIIINSVILFLMGEVAKGYENQYELESIKLKNKIELDHYETLKNKYIETQCMIHDIEKHISAIQKLSENRDFSEASEYAKKIRNDLKSYSVVFECTNRILSAVMSQKISQAEAKGINVIIDMENITFEFMDETDITSIFSNLLDNSIEACKELTNDKFISIKMKKFNNIILIDVTNSFCGKLISQQGKLKTTKKGHKGLGLTSIELAIQKYNGYMITDFTDNEFMTEILIPTE